MLRVPHRRIAGRTGYRFRLTSHEAAWRGEVNRSRCAWPSSGRANNAAISGVPSSVRPGGPTDRVVRRPTSATVGRRRCVPHRRGGSTRAEASGPGRAAARPAGDSPGRPRCRPVDRPPARRCRAPSNTHREPVASMAAATWVAKLGASSSPRASRSRCRAPSRPASARARVVFPLPAQPITTIRSGIGSVGAGRAAIWAR
jgi:hypothetical protein